MIEFKGRVLLSGSGKGHALVSKKEVSQLEGFEHGAENKGKRLIFADKKHKNLYKKNLTDKILILPNFKMSDINSTVLLSAAKKNVLPKCFLFSQQLDPATVAVFSLAKTFLNNQITVIDNLGQDFLMAVEHMDLISYNNGDVAINI